MGFLVLSIGPELRISTCTYLQAVQQEAALRTQFLIVLRCDAALHDLRRPCLHFIREATTRGFIRMVFKAPLAQSLSMISLTASRALSRVLIQVFLTHPFF